MCVVSFVEWPSPGPSTAGTWIIAPVSVIQVVSILKTKKFFSNSFCSGFRPVTTWIGSVAGSIEKITPGPSEMQPSTTLITIPGAPEVVSQNKRRRERDGKYRISNITP